MVPEPQDYVEILNLYSEYNLASDAGDAARYAACFVDTGLLVLGDEEEAVSHREAFSGDGPLTLRGIRVEGREELRDFKTIEASRRQHTYRRHLNGSIHLELLADGAVRGRCYLQAFNGDPGSILQLADTGVYEDRVIRTSEGWLYESRRLQLE